jgi:prepilin-type N-terminal cleavage/methylation domain-containing protein
MKTSRGFTLIEMLVVISIFTIMTAVVLANLPNFRERTALQLVAQKMSLTIREAQVYGVGVKSFDTDFPSHGIHFDPISPNGKKSYVLFADKPSTDNNDYDVGNNCGGSDTECVTRYDLTGSVEIQSVDTCNPTCTSRNLTGLNIVFDRPKTEANFTIPGNSTPPAQASYAKITLISTRSQETRTIWVWDTGQISVKIPPITP